MSVNGELLGFVHESDLKGSVPRSELKSLMRQTLPFSAYWDEFESGIRDDGELIAMEEVASAAEALGFLSALPDPFHGRSHVQNIRLIKVAAYLVANRLLSQPLIRRSLSLFATYEKLSPFRRFEAKLATIKSALNSLSLVLSEKSITAWLDATAAHRSHELFLLPHEFWFLVCNAADLSSALVELPQLEKDLMMRGNLFAIDACTKGNQNPRLRAQSHLQPCNVTKVRVYGSAHYNDAEWRRGKPIRETLSKPETPDEFRSQLWDKDLARKLKETLEAIGPRKPGNSAIAKRYRELSTFHRGTRSLAISPAPPVKRPLRRTVKWH